MEGEVTEAAVAKEVTEVVDHQGGGDGGGHQLPPPGATMHQPDGEPPRQWQNANQGNLQGGGT